MTLISQLVERIRNADEETKERILGQLRSAKDEEISALLHDWKQWARPNQLAPQMDIYGQAWPADRKWRNWLLLAGRGFGKTKAGAEQIRAWAESGEVKHMAMIGGTAADVRDVM